jgi:hypothetical protein
MAYVLMLAGMVFMASFILTLLAGIGLIVSCLTYSIFGASGNSPEAEDRKGVQ